MNPPTSDHGETSRLISGLLDGQLAPEERVRLELLIESDQTARRLYLAMIDQELELLGRFGAIDLACDDGSALDVVDRSSAQTGTVFHWRAIAAMAAMLVVALTFWFWGDRGERQAMRETWLPPLSWTADFEGGAAEGWVGTLSTANLPTGSAFAVRSVRENRAGSDASIISLPADWENGIFALSSRSWLQITFRHSGSSGEWLNVFMHTDGANPKAGEPAMYILRPQQFPGPAETWQTASIPFSAFVRKVVDPATGELKFSGGSPQKAERVLALIFSGSPDLEFVIDRIAISPDGPVTETLESLP